MESLPNLWFCGDSRAELFSAASQPDPGQPLWFWDAAAPPELAPESRAWFGEMDDAKPVSWRNEACLLATSSKSGVALIRRADRRVLFVGRARNAHSAEVLPQDMIAVACAEPCNSLHFFRIEENSFATEALAMFPFSRAHGAVFEPRSNLLWVGGGERLAAFELASSTGLPASEPVFTLALPDVQAHELLANPRAGGLIISTQNGVWEFDPASRQLRPFAPLARIAQVKAVSIEARSGIIAFCRGECGQWWSSNIYLLGPDGQLQMRTCAGRHLYKVRWDQNCQA